MNLTFVYYMIIVNNMEKVFNSTIAITKTFKGKYHTENHNLA